GTTTANLIDAAGNIRTLTDAKGQQTTYTYDALNRVTSITYQDSPTNPCPSSQINVTVCYEYDQGAGQKGRLTQITEPNSTTQYVYDQKGRLKTETRTINAVAYVTSYNYDGNNGRLTDVTYPGGRQVIYSLFDSMGRVKQIDTSKNGATQPVLSNVTYHPFGPTKGFSFANGQTYTRTFDLDGRIGTYTLGTQTFSVTYEASRVKFITDLGNTANPTRYDYDNLDRLTSMTAPGTSFSYT